MNGGSDKTSRPPRLGLILGVLGLLIVVIGVVARVGTTPPASTTTSTIGPGSTTAAPSSTTTLEPSSTTSLNEPPTTTTVTRPGQTEFDVIVVGDGMGGATAATVAARLGADTLLFRRSATWADKPGRPGCQRWTKAATATCCAGRASTGNS